MFGEISGTQAGFLATRPSQITDLSVHKRCALTGALLPLDLTKTLS